MQILATDRQSPPHWERAGAVPLIEPADSGLSFLGALETWGCPELLGEWQAAEQEAAKGPHRIASHDREKARLADIIKNAQRQRRSGTGYALHADLAERTRKAEHGLRMLERIDARKIAAAHRARAVETQNCLKADFLDRWRSGEFVCFGLDPATGLRRLIPTSLPDRLDAGRDVRVYRVANHPELIAQARPQAPASPDRAEAAPFAEPRSWLTLSATVELIAAVATSGDRDRALEALVAAAADGQIGAECASVARSTAWEATAAPCPDGRGDGCSKALPRSTLSTA